MPPTAERRFYVDRVDDAAELIMVDDGTGWLLTVDGWAPYPFSLSTGLGEGTATAIDERQAAEIAMERGYNLPDRPRS